MNPQTSDLAALLLSSSFVKSTQDCGGHQEELLNPAEYVSYQPTCNMEHCPESQPATVRPPVTFLPQHPYAQQPSNEPMYSNTSFSNAGPQAPLKFPKEQSVWPTARLLGLLQVVWYWLTCLCLSLKITPTGSPAVMKVFRTCAPQKSKRFIVHCLSSSTSTVTPPTLTPSHTPLCWLSLCSIACLLSTIFAYCLNCVHCVYCWFSSILEFPIVKVIFHSHSFFLLRSFFV